MYMYIYLDISNIFIVNCIYRYIVWRVAQMGNDERPWISFHSDA